MWKPGGQTQCRLQDSPGTHGADLTTDSFCVVLFFLETGSHYVALANQELTDQDSLKLKDPPASPSVVLRLKACIIMPSLSTTNSLTFIWHGSMQAAFVQEGFCAKEGVKAGDKSGMEIR